MKDLMKEVNLPEPKFNTEGMFSIVFYRPLKTVEKTVEKTAGEMIMELIKVNPKLTIKEMTKATGLTRRGVEYNLNKLKDNGSIERKGPDKGGFWEVKS